MQKRPANRWFSDSNLVFVILEICKKKSMMELHKRRGPLTEPEVRYYMKQICLGLDYLHDQKIIHRDLKVRVLEIINTGEGGL